MAGITWSPEALAQVASISNHINQFDPVAAASIAARLLAAGNGLRTFPNRGRLREDGTRELVIVRPYVIRYDVTAAGVDILDVRHGTQRGDK